MTRAPFRSWAEDYVRPVDEPPIDRIAFGQRARQRARIQRLLNGRIAKTDSYTRARYEMAMAGGLVAEHADRERRATDPIERARLFVQRCGVVVYRATVVGGPPGRWKIEGRPGFVDDEQLLDLARAKGWVA